MHGVVDELLVGSLLLTSVLYIVYSMGPRALRRRALHGTSALLRRLPGILGLHELAQRLETAASAKAKGACGGCDNCAAEPTSNPAPAEVRIPLSKVGKR
jgi:hypothetical protein